MRVRLHTTIPYPGFSVPTLIGKPGGRIIIVPAFHAGDQGSIPRRVETLDRLSLNHNLTMSRQWRVQDFPLWGGCRPMGGALTSDTCAFQPKHAKTKELDSVGGSMLVAPLDPPMQGIKIAQVICGGWGSIPREGRDIAQCLSKSHPHCTKGVKWYQQM